MKYRIARLAIAILTSVIALFPLCALADEGGVGYWFNGSLGSLSAAKQTPGCAILSIFYFYFANQGETINATLKNGETASANAKTFVYLPGVGCTPRTKILGGQLSFSLVYPPANTSINGTATVTGNPPTTVHVSDFATAMADFYPNVNLRWNHGVNDYLVYVQPGVPIGPYDPKRLAQP